MVDFVRQTQADANKPLEAEREVVDTVDVFRLHPGRKAIPAKSVSVSSSGDNTAHTPASGKAIRLAYLSLSADAGNTAAVVALVKLTGVGEPYKVSLVAGAIWARNVGAGLRFLLGNTDAPLVVNLNAAQQVHVSFEYDEVP